MIGVRVGHQHRVEHRKLVDGHSRWSNPPQDTSKGRIEIRVGEDSLPTDLEEECRMSDVSDPDSFGRARIGIRRPGRLIAR